MIVVAMTERPMHIPQRRYDLRAMLGQLLAIYHYHEISSVTGIPVDSLRNWRTKAILHPSWVHVDALIRLYLHIYGEDRLGRMELREPPTEAPPKKLRKPPLAPMPSAAPTGRLLRLKQIVGDPNATPPIPALIPVAKSTWWAGVKSGIYPQPVKSLGQRITAWRESDIRALIKSMK